MAKTMVKMPEEFLKKLSTLGSKTDEISKNVLEAGGEVVYEQVKDNLSSVVSGESSGELVASLGMTPVKQDRDGNFNIKIGFKEPRSDGKSNAMIANILEYGKHNQPPRPFLAPAKRKSKKECIETMKSKLEEEINKIWIFYPKLNPF